MSLRSANSLRIAILGSGVSGSAAARTLADRGLQVTIFEAGQGIGGRSSTRITRDEQRYQFDHGAQYISSPTTNVFRNALSQWETDGWIKNWSGNFFTGDKEGVIQKDEDKERWVGYPAMHSICRNLLHHENIRVHLQSRANATYTETGEWSLVHGRSKDNLANYDWLIVTDRISSAHYRRDLASADVDEFRIRVRMIQSVKTLAAMIVFDRPLNFNLDMDGIEFNDRGTVFGSLGWAARDSSKPGRERKDGKECWILHSHPKAATRILKGTQSTEEIRNRIKETMVVDFLKSIPILAKNEQVDVPSIVHSVGHRWGAAVPLVTKEFMDKECEVIGDKKFIACGDYFGKLSGSYEGAYLSGLSAANQLCKLIQ